ncbi:ExbD/TolR family protein [Parerythrobacter lacustris]|uniref:Biopolymer transporter ExbD n=1 Tax=Parerythrobacter lacustris TaxID=2969984 RepID=A0ABT1XSX2_9SPHN|nr:biopolymer transporter ExbD [Parerythrobacter lacustris]MCR2834307.1 biopolymer transporter ExbD [Parerythrobacter lacustris]
MAISTGGGGDERPMSDINTTPLVDVMLVLLIIFLIAVPVAIKSIEDLKMPILETVESEDKVENLLLTVTTTDAAGRTPSTIDTAFEGASREGECRVYFNNITPVDSQELFDLSLERLENLVEKAGGAEALAEDPDKVPQVHIRADVNAPWRCVAGTIFNVQMAGYPTVGFISNPVDPNG